MLRLLQTAQQKIRDIVTNNRQPAFGCSEPETRNCLIEINPFTHRNFILCQHSSVFLKVLHAEMLVMATECLSRSFLSARVSSLGPSDYNGATSLR